MRELTTEPSIVVHRASARRITYGEIISNLSISSELPEVRETELKSEDDFRIIGSNIPRYDVAAKVNGSAIYSIDVDLPGMLYATVLHSPVKGGEPLKVNNEHVLLQRPGVLRVLTLKDAVAIVADNFQAAYLAEKELTVDWSEVSKLKNHSNESSLDKHLAMVSDLEKKGLPIQEKGDITEALSQASTTYESEYFSDYFYHAHLEPLNAVANVKSDGSVDVWAGTQAPTHCTRSVAAELSIDVPQVNLHRTYLGGAFGRRGAQDHDFVIDAVQVSREMGKPVKVIWSRESDVKCGRF